MAKLMLGTQVVSPALYSGQDDWGESLQGNVVVQNSYICAPSKCSTNYRITSFSAPNMSEDSTLKETFMDCVNLTSISFPTPTHILARQFKNMCYGCTSLTTIPTFSNTITIGDEGLSNAFYGCTSLTTAPTFANVTTVGKSSFSSCFQNCTSLTIAPTFASLTNVGYQALSNAFYGCTSLTTAPTFASLTSIENGELYNCFNGCTNLTIAPTFASLKTLKKGGLYNCFYGCTSLTTITFPVFDDAVINPGPDEVNRTDLWGLSYAFYNCESLSDIYFPALKTTSFGTYKYHFSSMFNSNTASTSGTCTVHFPSNLQTKVSTFSGYPLFGGTSGRIVLAFDLPATS